MNISQAGINLIKGFEGLSLKPYRPVPTEKYLTIGFGHYGSDVSPSMVITTAQAEQLLRNDLASFVAGVNGCLKVAVNQNQFDALVSFAYNLGVQCLQTSTMLQYINQGNFTAAANEFPRFCHSNGIVLQGLLNRRNKERILFLTPMPIAILFSVKVITGALNIRKGNGNGTPNPNGAILRAAPKGETFHVFHAVNGWFDVGQDYWISGNSIYVNKL